MAEKKKIFTLSSVTIFIFRRVIIPILAIHLCIGVIAYVRNQYLRTGQYAAVLISDYAFSPTNSWASPLACFGAFPYWTYYFNNRGMKACWTLHAKSTHLAAVIRDTRCQSIVLVGHGSFNMWLATDKEVTNREVEEMMSGLPRKQGEWLQLTCGVSDAYPVKMGELVMDKEKVFTYTGPVNSYVFITDALFGFKYLKKAGGAKQAP